MSRILIMLMLSVLGLGCLFLYFDSMAANVATSALEMSGSRIGQARVVYGFGIFASVLGNVLLLLRSPRL